MIEIPITVVVLAAGRGTRLGSLRFEHSKAMTPILGVPVVQRVVEGFASVGCREFVAVTSPDDEQLISWAEGFRPDRIEIKLAFQEQRKGTAHALWKARPYIHQDFALTSCDNIFPEQHLSTLITAHLAHQPPAVLTTADFGPKDLDRSAGVRLRGNMVHEIKEKPGRDSTGWDAISKFLYVFRKDFADCLDAVGRSPRGEYELQDAITLFMDMSDEFCRAIKAGEFLHLTSTEDLLAMHRYYLDHNRRCIIHPSAKVEQGVTMVHPVMVDRDARVYEGCVLGPYLYVGRGAEVGQGARAKNSVIYPGASLAAGQEVKDSIVA